MLKVEFKNIGQYIVKNWVKFLISFILVVIVGMELIQINQINDLKSDLYYCEQEKEEVEDKLEETLDEVEELETKLRNCESNLSYSESENSELENRVFNLESELFNNESNSSFY